MADETAAVHLRIPAATKARWVRESRAAGMRLTDWIVSRVEAALPDPKHTATALSIKIPADLDFSALRLARDADGAVSFDTSVIAQIEAASGLPAGFFMRQHEDAIAELISHWYARHRADGGAPDLVQEDLIAEARIEDERGGGFSHEPGRA